MGRRDELVEIGRGSGFSIDAVESMLASMGAGHGRMAQFDHPEFGGAGQWMSGGMLMVADCSDSSLRRRVGLLCDQLERWLEERPFEAREDSTTRRREEERMARGPRHAWWPSTLGVPEASGAQNDVRYAWFAGARRLAIDDGHGVTIYDTDDHVIGGVSQQQGATRTLAFASQHGPVPLDRLRRVDGDSPASTRSSERAVEHAIPLVDEAAPLNAGRGSDPFDALKRLAELHASGVLSDQEFATKKTELLDRI